MISILEHYFIAVIDPHSGQLQTAKFFLENLFFPGFSKCTVNVQGLDLYALNSYTLLPNPTQVALVRNRILLYFKYNQSNYANNTQEDPNHCKRKHHIDCVR